MLKDLNGSWLFYTSLPCLPWPKPNFKRVARFSPFVGIIIGSIQSTIWILLSKSGWREEPLSLLTIGMGIWLTGGLHLDGLIDTADGIGAGEEKCFEAMKDSRIGSSGLQAGILVLLIQAGSIMKLGSLAPIIFPITGFLGRLSSLWAIQKFPYIGEGNSSFHKNNWKGWKDFNPSILGLLIIFSYALTINAIRSSIIINLTVVCLFVAMLVPEGLGKRLGGHTGDSYGASLVIVETLTLLFFAIILS